MPDGTSAQQRRQGRAVRRLPSWVLVLLVGGLLVAAYLPAGALVGATVQSLIYLAVAVGAAATAVVTAVRRTTDRLGWWLIAAGLTSAVVGDVLWGSYELLTGSQPPSPWYSDVAYLAGWAAIVAGVAVLVTDPVPARRMTARLDVCVLCIAGGVGLWFAVAEPMVAAPELSGLGLAVALAYPVTDLALLGIVATLLLDPQAPSLSLRLLTAAGAAQFLGDAMYVVGLPDGAYSAGDPSNLWWLAALVLLAAATAHPSSARVGTVGGPPESLSRRRVLVLWAAVVVTAVTAMVGTVSDVWRSSTTVLVGAGIGAAATILVTTLVLWRLALATGALRETLDDRRRLQRRLEHEANHDALTGLANRRRFAEASRARGDGAVVFVDLDRFKEINDRLGHAAGDEVLRIVAARLVDALRPDDLVARLGGDEFAVLLEDRDAAVVGDVATRLLELVRAPMTLGNGTEVRVDASVGTATARPDGATETDLLRDADVAMYEAKRAGRSRVTAYSTEVHDEVTQRLAVQADLGHAAERGQLSVAYQPIVAVGDRRPIGVEALLRWQHPTLGAIGPDEFIPLAETSGDIIAIGRWVLDEACRTIGGLVGEVGRLQLSVNVSPVQLHHGGFATTVEEVLARHDFDPSALTLEITESVLLEDAPIVRQSVERLRARGVRFSVDDFGTGYSALRYLRDVPLDELKIDRSFVAGIGDGPEAAAFALAMVNLARTFRLTTVAEGIETEDQLATLTGEGCHLGQGYLFSRPLPPSELVGWLAAQQPDGTADGLLGAGSTHR